MGRRWGKTVLAGGSSLAVAYAGGDAAWIVPTYKNSRPVWRFATRAVAPLAKRKLAEVHKTDRVITFKSGGSLGVYTADNPVGILGEAFDYVVIDEAARIGELVWTETIQATLADRGGRALLISTPKGLNWFWNEWRRGQDEAFPEYQSWHAPSSANPNPWIKRAAELARSRLTDLTYRQEWLAEFLSGEGTVFRRVQELAVSTPLDRARPGRRYVMGVDLASTTDFTVVTVLDVTEQPHRQVFLDRWTGIPWRLQLARIQTAFERFAGIEEADDDLSGVAWNERVAAMWARHHEGEGPQPLEYTGQVDLVEIDRTGIGDMPFQELAMLLPAGRAWGVQFNAGNKMDMVQNLALAFERGRIETLPDGVQTGELLAYSAKKRPSGVMSYSAPDGQHDDTVAALLLAEDAADAPGFGVVEY